MNITQDLAFWVRGQYVSSHGQDSYITEMELGKGVSVFSAVCK